MERSVLLKFWRFIKSSPNSHGWWVIQYLLYFTLIITYHSFKFNVRDVEELWRDTFFYCYRYWSAYNRPSLLYSDVDARDEEEYSHAPANDTLL